MTDFFEALSGAGRLLLRVVSPAEEPVTLDEVKDFIKLDGSGEDAQLSRLIAAARERAEHWMRRSIITQRWRISLDYGVADSVWLPMGPVRQIISVSLIDTENTSQALSSDAYWLNAARTMAVFLSPLTAHRVEIEYETGFGAAADVPADIKTGLLGDITFMYENRGDNSLPVASTTHYQRYREMRI